ncbi:hypothetical protein FQR65_LT18937 [Abscondita terminalis]|nr:hypothetical protein FQR65_LT18937 [Abscondita terminalis]
MKISCSYLQSLENGFKLARHPERTAILDYVGEILLNSIPYMATVLCDDWVHGCGLARFNAITWDGCNPEGYRKSQRLLDMAERFNLPVFTFIDTMGAYPGIGAEERGQAEAIATSLAQLSSLKVPVIATVLGEGGSGGALGIGVADRVVMLSHSIYSVISPEGCASILWKTADKAEQASEALALTADKLKELGVVEYVVDEGEGAHLQPFEVMEKPQDVLNQAAWNDYSPMTAEDRCEARYQRLMKFGSDNLGLAS